MTTAEFDRLLKARGWRYDAGEEQFFDGERELDWEELITLTPDLTLDELASYQDDKWLLRRAAELAATGVDHGGPSDEVAALWNASLPNDELPESPELPQCATASTRC